jgi:hypothetical protein
LGLTFFGLTPEYKIEVHRAILTAAHYSKGAFSVLELYEMPVYLRTFYLKEFSELKKRESSEIKAATKKRKSS